MLVDHDHARMVAAQKERDALGHAVGAGVLESEDASLLEPGEGELLGKDVVYRAERATDVPELFVCWGGVLVIGAKQVAARLLHGHGLAEVHELVHTAVHDGISLPCVHLGVYHAREVGTA